MKILDDLHKLINRKGVAYVSYHLGYRDPRAIQQWLQREKIPDARVEAVKAFIKKESQ